MDRKPTSFHPPTSLAPLPSDDHMVLGATATYPSSTTAVSSYPCDTHSLVGLGISHGEMHTPVSNLSVYTAPEAFAYPTATTTASWTTQSMVPGPLFDNTMHVGHLSPPATYEPFVDRTDDSTSPMSYYSSQALSVSSSYGPMVDMGSNPDGMTHAFRSWSNTPVPVAGGLADDGVEVKTEPEDTFDLPSVAETNETVEDSLFNQWHKQQNLYSVAPSYYPPPAYHANVVKSDPHEDSLVSEVRRTSPSNAYKKGMPKPDGCTCTVCGYHFTRRSNCMEHMKKHDPSRKRTFICNLCGNTLGRKADLNRHIDSIHLGLRKFGCEKCGQRFTRQDILNRHSADGCYQSVRKATRAKKSSRDQQSQSPEHSSKHD
ncbi:hypothetical protein P168DRAFT_324306 [Aspergillus campestris IBT 28561]|uniref:C2H2-type domain-containing protein n=1 Tax=Aspergillus campestris (strain IBT 28561) TaxID=1392248 RepID=A0A2I1DHG9_ASPC2|nr:uncharacterized protein P168DRAFT_324306 [Aspergillus campestris IBT 28561]PKY09322.1 hypothetical protein P168DRAFT_324306 [Aspergillus campestris IBT 28561]